MNYLLTYATHEYLPCQRKNKETALEHGFDHVVMCTPASLGTMFVAENYNILKENRGAGYWLWKPYLILEKLKVSEDNDTIMYCDSGAHFIKSVSSLLSITGDIVLFHFDPIPENCHAQQTKRDAFVLMDCEQYAYSYPIAHGAFQIYRKTDRAIAFLEEYLSYCKDRRIISDDPNVMGKDNYPEFKAHRHDQSVLGLLAAKHGIQTYLDPSQYGNKYRQEGLTGQIINHTRLIR